MAEQPQGFARRMMAQKLMTDARNTPGSDSPFFANRVDSAVRQMPDIIDASISPKPTNLGRVAYGAGAMGTLFAPGAGVVDIFGGAPDPFRPGEMLPSFGENIGQGNYLDAGLQTLGAAGDVALAAGALFPPALPAAAALGTALKAPRAAKVADAAMDAADAAKIDPNQAAGGAMDLAQARYFETGQFEPPTAENPVSVVLPTETEPGIIAFHGSGADFDEFRLEMIGTGEGAQAYGYGLYFTDSEDIAKFYRDSIGRGRSSIVYDGSSVKNAREVDGLTDREMVLDNIATEMAFFDQKPANVIERKIKSLKARIDDPVDISPYADDAEAQELADLIRQSAQRDLKIYESLDPDKFTRGKMYKVALSPKPDELLDYDLPITEQTKKVQDALFANDEIAMIIQRKQEDDGLIPEFYTGQELYQDLAENLLSEQAASIELSEAGILGLKYRAAGSRGAATADEAAERNYVIFDDKAVKILEKYGIAGPVLVTGAAVAASKAGNDNEDGGSILPDAGII